MAQIAIYLDRKTAELLNRTARREGMSRSAWVAWAVRAGVADRLPSGFFAVLGTWQDDRTPAQILRDIRGGARQRGRGAFR